MLGNGSADLPLEPDEYPPLDVGVAHPARIYSAWLGGKDHFAVDRMAAAAGMRAFPAIAQSVRANKGFIARGVAHLTAREGIRQFLEIGPGLPAPDNTHEIAQRIAPECRVAYVDHDPVVLLHAQVLLTSSAPGVTCCIDADLRDPEAIRREAARVLDFSQPVAIVLSGVLQFTEDADHPHQIVDVLMAGVPAGSYLVVSHLARDISPARLAAFASAVNKHSIQPVVLRDHAEVSMFFDGLDLLDPGVVQVNRWRPASETMEATAPVAFWGGIARKRP